MLIDLDGLKAVNDLSGHEAGHEAGDNAIRAVARTLQRTCRSTDLAARIGGDEFVVLAPELEARSLAERIRKALTTEASWVATALPPLTLSIGVADTRSVHELRPDRLYSAADRALYEAKQGGKNRVALAPVVEDDQDEAGGCHRASVARVARPLVLRPVDAAIHVVDDGLQSN